MKRITLLLLLLLISTGVALADGPYQLEWTVMAGGGGSATDGVYSLGATAGQRACGVAGDGVYSLQAGFWYVRVSLVPPEARYSVYLPLVMRNQ
ncbi:MAG TPA: hypothetical protein ENG33_10175 [Chloroflexi bacterium]|nr:hypothetical protein [Chloroflexota bacterium]